jgi:hypothetical protein
MRWFTKPAVYVLAAILAAPLFAADDDKAAKDKKDAADKKIATGQVGGKLKHWGSDSKSITLQVTFEVPNPGGLQTLANLEVQRADASRDPNPVNRARRVADVDAQIAIHRKDAVKNENHDIEFQPADELVVRWRNLPVVLDDKGKPKKLTDKEKKDLKGDNPKLPGYNASKEDLKNDQLVTVFLVKKKENKEVKKDKEPEKPVVTMIVIEVDPK